MRGDRKYFFFRIMIEYFASRALSEQKQDVDRYIAEYIDIKVVIESDKKSEL